MAQQINLSRPSFTVDQDDGARWAVHEDPDDVSRYTILTSAGHDLVQGTRSGELWSLMQQYREAELGQLALNGTGIGIRQELGRGQEAIVYSMGPYAVREQIGLKSVYHALGELERMDAINSVIETGLPRWLNLPAHYALQADPERGKTYTLMDRVDGGVTVEDVQNYPDLSPEKIAAVEKEVGHRIQEAQAKLPHLFDMAYEILARQIEEKGKDPSKFLTDWHPRNVLVQSLGTPVAGQRFGLSVIDQYRS
jgi:hypothetical protein